MAGSEGEQQFLAVTDLWLVQRFNSSLWLLQIFASPEGHQQPLAATDLWLAQRVNRSSWLLQIYGWSRRSTVASASRAAADALAAAAATFLHTHSVYLMFPNHIVLRDIHCITDIGPKVQQQTLAATDL